MSKVQSVQSKGPNLFIVGFALFFLCGLVLYSPNGLEFLEANQLLPIIVPYISYSGSKIVIQSIFVFFCFLLGIQKSSNRFRQDWMIYFLEARLVLGVFQILSSAISGANVNFGNYYLYFLELLFYLGCVMYFTSNYIAEEYLKLVKLFVLIVAVETIIQCLLVVVPQAGYLSTWYKANMNIPIGSSNFISTLILPIAVAELFNQGKQSKWNFLYLFILIVAIILTKSRFATSILVLAFLKAKIFHKGKAFTIFLFLLLTIIGIYYTIVYSDVVITFFYGFSDEVSGSQINKLSSGRLSGYDEYYDTILQNLIIGYGPTYIKSRAHNIIIDILYQNGIVGLVMFIMAIAYLFNRYKKLKKRYAFANYMQYISVIIITILIQSLGEISYFTSFYCDAIFLPCLALFVVGLRKKYLILKPYPNGRKVVKI